MNRRHPCGWPHCGTAVPNYRWGCPEHWRALPRELRGRITRAYTAGDREGLLRAHRAAIIWIRDGILPEAPAARRGQIRLPAGRQGKRHYWEG